MKTSGAQLQQRHPERRSDAAFKRKDPFMKLTADRIDKTLAQFEALPVPENHPAIHQFSELFGDHTFFLYGDGLSIVEPSSLEGGRRDLGQVVKLASWTDESHKTLAPHPREVTGITVELGRAA